MSHTKFCKMPRCHFFRESSEDPGFQKKEMELFLGATLRAYKGSLCYQPKQCITIREIPKNYHIDLYCLIPLKMGNIMARAYTQPYHSKPKSAKKYPAECQGAFVQHLSDVAEGLPGGQIFLMFSLCC